MDEDLDKEKEPEKDKESAANADNKEIINGGKTNGQAPQDNDSIDDKSANESEKQAQESEKEEKVIPPIIPKKNKEGSFKPIVFVMIVSMVIAFFWDKIPFIKDSVHAILNPSAGWLLLNLNITLGMLVIVFIISISTTLIQKYATDQEALRELKKEQKILQEEMKKYKEHPEKMAELSKKQFAFIPKTFKLTSRSIMFTGIPFILFFRWFNDFFAAMEVATGAPVKFLGFFTWFWFYLIFTMIFSTILRKALKVV